MVKSVQRGQCTGWDVFSVARVFPVRLAAGMAPG